MTRDNPARLIGLGSPHLVLPLWGLDAIAS